MKIYREETIIVQDVQDTASLKTMVERYLKVESAELIEPVNLHLIGKGGACKIKVRRWLGSIE